MAKQISNFWVRLCGIIATFFGAVFHSDRADAYSVCTLGGCGEATSSVTLTDSEVSALTDWQDDCDYSVKSAVDGVTTWVCNSGFCERSSSGDDAGTTSSYSGEPIFCWDGAVNSNIATLCQQHFIDVSTDWTCDESVVQTTSDGIEYNSCNRINEVICGVGRAYRSGTVGSNPISVLSDYGSRYVTAMKIIGCVSGSLRGASSGAIKSDLNGVACVEAVPTICKSDGPSGIDKLNIYEGDSTDTCYIKAKDTVQNNLYDAAGTFIYIPNSCICKYNGVSLCS